MEIKKLKIEPPPDVNIICGQSHFIKTAEDLFEALVISTPGIKFGLAFNEASGPCLVRYEGNDETLTKLARDYARRIGAGHFFIILIRDAFPINVLDRIKACPEILSVFCATANPIELLYVEDDQGKGIVGVIDGFAAKGIETAEDRNERYAFLRKIKYKLS